MSALTSPKAWDAGDVEFTVLAPPVLINPVNDETRQWLQQQIDGGHAEMGVKDNGINTEHLSQCTQTGNTHRIR